MRRTSCELRPEQADRGGIVWVLGSFVLCPCHLPITFWVGDALYGFNLMRHPRIDSYTRRSAGFLRE